MIERQAQVQTAVYAALEAVFDEPVAAYPLPNPRYIRIEGFTANNDEAYKNAESSTHRFTVSVFEAPEGGTRSLGWVWLALARAQAALKAIEVAGATLVAEDTQAWLESKSTEGSVYYAQGFIRYRVQIGA